VSTGRLAPEKQTESVSAANRAVRLLQELLEHTSEAVFVLGSDDTVIDCNPRAELALGARRGELLGLPLSELVPMGSPLLALLAVQDADEPLRLEVELERRDGGFVPVEMLARRLDGGATLLLCRDTTVSRSAEQALERSERRFMALVKHSSDVTIVLDGSGGVSYVSPSIARLGVHQPIYTESQLWRVLHPRDRARVECEMNELKSSRAGSSPQSPPRVSRFRYRVRGEWRWVEAVGTDLRDDPDVRGIVLNVRDVTEREESAQRLRVSEAYYRAIFEKSLEGVVLFGRDRRVRSVSGAVVRMLGHPADFYVGTERSDHVHPDDLDAFNDAFDMAEAVPGITEGVRYRFRDARGEWRWLEGTVTNLLEDPDVRAFVHNFRDISDRVRAMEKIQNLNDELKRRLDHVQSLRRIDMAITNSVDVRLVLDIFMDQLVQDLGVDAVAVLLYEPAGQVLRPSVGRGFTAELRQRLRLALGDGPAGRAALEQRSIFLPDLANEPQKGAAIAEVQQEEFASYMAVPMFAKGQLQGVIELYTRQTLEPDDEWLEFLETYADQGAIAIENAQLLRSLERSNVELQRAYDRTIAGWANALDLKDEDTAGHSKRVTDMTVRLARRLGMTTDELVHVQRGALLHDIGKMGIPDSILLKRGPLTDEEFEVMRRHPVYAYELLGPIEFLRPALDIPYAHHERWDGTGYPRGLKGEEIPLAARIFAIVDVFDALTSDRPYRKAWTREEALAHIRRGVGTHFDPRVAEAFFELIETSGE